MKRAEDTRRHEVISELVDHAVHGSYFLNKHFNVYGSYFLNKHFSAHESPPKKHEVYIFTRAGLNSFFAYLRENPSAASTFSQMVEKLEGVDKVMHTLTDDRAWIVIYAFLMQSTLIIQRDMETGKYKGFYLVFVTAPKNVCTFKAGIDEGDIYNYDTLGFYRKPYQGTDGGAVMITDNVLDCLLVDMQCREYRCVALNGGSVEGVLERANTCRFKVSTRDKEYGARIIKELKDRKQTARHLGITYQMAK